MPPAVIAAGVGAAGAIGGAALSSRSTRRAAETASNAEVGMQRENAALAREFYNRNTANFQPWMQSGGRANALVDSFLYGPGPSGQNGGHAPDTQPGAQPGTNALAAPMGKMVQNPDGSTSWTGAQASTPGSHTFDDSGMHEPAAQVAPMGKMVTNPDGSTSWTGPTEGIGPVNRVTGQPRTGALAYDAPLPGWETPMLGNDLARTPHTSPNQIMGNLGNSGGPGGQLGGSYTPQLPGTQTPGAQPGGGQPAAGTGPSGYDAFVNSAYYQHPLQEGYRALNHGYAANGMIESGDAMRGITQYGQDYASGRMGEFIGLAERQSDRGIQGASAIAGVGANALASQSAANSAIGNSQANRAIAGGVANANMWNTVGGALGNFAGAAFGSGNASSYGTNALRGIYAGGGIGT